MTIRQKLFFSSFVVTFGLIWLLFAFNFSRNNLNLLANTQTKIEEITKNTLTLRRNEKDFIIRRDNVYLNLHKQNFEILHQNLLKLEQNLKELHLNNFDLQSIHLFFHDYKKNFQQFVTIAKKFDRMVAHDLLFEFIVTSNNLKDLSTNPNTKIFIMELHLLEQNFLLSKDLNYANTFESKINHLLNSKEFSNETLKSKLIQYKTTFLEIVEYSKVLGLDENSGLIGTLRNNFHSAENALNTINKQLSTIIENQINNEKFFANSNILLIIVLILLATYFLLFSINKPLKELEEKKKFIEILIQSIPIPIFYKDIEGKYLNINKAFTQTFGISHDEIIGKTVFDIAPKEFAQQYKQHDDELLNIDEQCQIYESRVKNLKNNNEFDVIFYKSVFKNTKDQPAGIIGTAIDITQRKNDEKQLRAFSSKLKELNNNLEQQVLEQVNKNIQKELQLFESAKLAAMGGMIGNIIHQWKQPLNLISLIASNLKLKSEIEQKIELEQLQNDSQLILDTVNRLTHITSTFRNFLKEKKEYKTINLQERVNETLTISQIILQDKGIQLIQETPTAEPIEIQTVANELSEVIINIINNAIDALVDNKIEDPWVKVTVSKNKHYAIIDIEDNALGISNEVMPYIFEEYFTTKDEDKGTGLGLYMSYKIITQSLQGKLYAKNTQNGAKFTIELPLHNTR